MSVNNKLIPSYLFEAYDNIIKCNLISNKVLTDDSVMEFQSLLNTSIPHTESDINYKEVIKYLYRKNPCDFYKLIISSRLKNIVLWTESKCIVSHFGLRNIVYIKWDKDDVMYKCNIHNNIKSDSFGTNANLIKCIGMSTFLQNNGYNRNERIPYKINNRYNEYNRDRRYIKNTYSNRFNNYDKTQFKRDVNTDVVIKNKYANLEITEIDTTEDMTEDKL